MRDYTSIINALSDIDVACERDLSMARLTSFGIGGPADLLVAPETPEQISTALDVLAQEGVPVFVIGGGTNLLPADEGFRGVLLRASSLKCDPWKEGNFIAGAALPLDVLILNALKNGLSGGEALYGIPGSVGGAIAMNAGAYGVWTGNILTGITAFDMTGAEVEIDLENSFDYRVFAGRGKVVIAEAEFTFMSLDDPNILRAKALEFSQRRSSTQPVGEKSAGCIFKNPGDDHAGRLIEAAGLKGRRIGDAKVSEIHGNFIINIGSATARDIIELIGLIRDTVMAESGVELGLEVVTPGYEI